MSTSIVWDIETGGLPEEELKKLYHEKSAEEFAADCDKRWKPETVTAKYEEYKVTAWAEFQERAALSAITGRVVAIGLKSHKGVKILAAETPDAEPDVLKAFWQLVVKATGEKRRMIGHNIGGFDIPFLCRRSWLLGIEVPVGQVFHGRYLGDTFLDTMTVWACGMGPQERISLDTLSRALGGPGKPEGEGACTGAIFAKLFLSGNAEDKAKAIQYLESDLENTWIVAERMGLL